ncbi:hypothetical protein [Chroococcidiopsis sp.]|uniref:hypothetical protein n=1 Tax=Chroococcidiopsis sp. TaxID=3088168 RepID=UPI003F2E71EA
MNDELINSQDSHKPITVLVSRHPCKGKEREFEKALSDTIDVALQFPGHLGVTILKPQANESDAYRIIVKFDCATHYQQWYRSRSAIYWFNVLARLEKQPPNFEVMTGLEAWFAISNSATLRPIVPPSRYKMAIITWLAIFPLIVGINLLFGNVLSQLPMLLRSLILSATLVFLMTYIVMPRMTKLFSRWLYPSTSKS